MNITIHKSENYSRYPHRKTWFIPQVNKMFPFDFAIKLGGKI